MRSERAPFEICGQRIPPGTRQTVDLPISVMSNHTPITLPVHVIHGARPGPTLFVSAAVHGDEIIGVEIVRRLLRRAQLARLRGTLLAIPIVNAYGFINHSRYLPDRRDLNRCFPGSERGSLAARLAHLFLTEVVKRSQIGIDLHAASTHRVNLPQIRVAPGDEEAMRLAQAFGPPLILTSRLREGSLRLAAQNEGVRVLLYEAGESLRFDEIAIRAGVSGVLRVMLTLNMIQKRGVQMAKFAPVVSTATYWVRAPAGGVLRTYKNIGASVTEGEVVGVIADPFGDIETEVKTFDPGIVLGRTNLPVVNEGDALFHVAALPGAAAAEARVEALSQQLQGEPMFDEDEII